MVLIIVEKLEFYKWLVLCSRSENDIGEIVLVRFCVNSIYNNLKNKKY